MTYWLFRIIVGIIRLMPRSCTLAMGRALAVALYYLLPLRQDEARRNIARAFPDLPTDRRRAILRGTYRHYCQLFFDYFRMPKYTVDTLPQLVDMDETHIKEVRESGRGAVLVSGHHGNWEVVNLALCRLGYPVTGIAVTQQGGGGRVINEIRAEAGAKILSPKASSRTMLRHLKEGQFLGLIADQDARSHGVWVDFFGQPSSRPRGGAVFGLQLGLPIFFVSSLMGPDRRYQIRFRPIDMDNLPDEKEAAIRELTQRFMVMLEDEVCEYPEQYFWFHRMWKTKPPGDGTPA